MSHRRYITSVDGIAQSESIYSFCGGVPLMPARCELPVCGLCGAQQTFFFQVRLSTGDIWDDKCLAVFHCTECADERFFIPPMVEGKLAAAHISESFLKTYEKNFRLIHFSSSDNLVLRRDSVEKVRFSSWHTTSENVPADAHSFIGGRPEWAQDDETPAEYGLGGSFEFLMQLAEGTEFKLVDSAPGQVTLGLDRKPKRLKRRSYRLFLGNQTFFFGAVLDKQPAGVYTITQRY